MANEQIAEAKLVLEVVEQVQNLSLHAHVEGRNRLVANEELGLQGQGAGNTNSLPLASRKLMRVLLGILGGKAHGLQQLRHPVLALGGIFVKSVNREGFLEQFANPHAGRKA